MSNMELMNSLGGIEGGSGALNGLEMKKLMSIIGNQIKDKDLENLKLKLSKDYELKLKDMEKLHYERMTLTK